MIEPEVQIDSWKPQELRLQALNHAQLLGSGPAAYFRLVEVDGALRYADMEAASSFRELFVSSEGAVAHETSVARQTDHRSWTAAAPREESRNRFMTFEEDYGFQLDTLEGSDTHRAFYGPAEITDQARALFYDGTEFLGFVGVMRGCGEFFAPRAVDNLNQNAAHVHRLLLLARTAEREENTGALHFIASETGGVLYADERCRCWLTERRAEQVRRGLESGRVFIVDSLAASVGWLDDGHRKLRHIVLSPVQPLRASAWHHLSKTQRDIVGLALEGLSNREIARLKGISTSTVKYHLNEAARTLDVRGRTGLRQALAWGPHG